jgi:hypothetical protein
MNGQKIRGNIALDMKMEPNFLAHFTNTNTIFILSFFKSLTRKQKYNKINVSNSHEIESERKIK